MSNVKEEENVRVVMEAFHSAFNERNVEAFEKYWSADYIQHSAHIGPGRDGLRDLITAMPATFRYEAGPITASGDLVMVQGRFSGFSDVAWITVDIVRLKEGLLIEHWDVIQDEATEQQSKSGLPMFGSRFATGSSGV